MENENLRNHPIKKFNDDVITDCFQLNDNWVKKISLKSLNYWKLLTFENSSMVFQYNMVFSLYIMQIFCIL